MAYSYTASMGLGQGMGGMAEMACCTLAWSFHTTLEQGPGLELWQMAYQANIVPFLVPLKAPVPLKLCVNKPYLVTTFRYS